MMDYGLETRKLRMMAYRYVHNWADVEDVVQDTLLAWWTKAASDVRYVQRPMALLTVILRHEAWGLLQRHKRCRTLFMEAAGADDRLMDLDRVPDPRPDPETIVIRQELCACVLARLGGRKQHVVQQILDGYSWAEIRGTLGSTPIAQKVFLCRLKQEIRGLVERCPPAGSVGRPDPLSSPVVEEK